MTTSRIRLLLSETVLTGNRNKVKTRWIPPSISLMLRQYYLSCDSYSGNRWSAANYKKICENFLLALQIRPASPISAVFFQNSPIIWAVLTENRNKVKTRWIPPSISLMLRQYYLSRDSYSANRWSAANEKKSAKTFYWRYKFVLLRLLAPYAMQRQ